MPRTLSNWDILVSKN